MYLSAAFEEKAFESRAGAHQGLDAVLRDLITPGDVQLLQQGTTLTERRHKEKGEKQMMASNNLTIRTKEGKIQLQLKKDEILGIVTNKC